MNDQARIQDNEVTLGDKRVEINTVERYKGRKGVTDRLAIITKGVLLAKAYYYQGQGAQGTTFRAPESEETLTYVKNILGDPNQRFGILVFHYLTDDKGNLIELERCRGRLKTWVFSETRYQELSGVHNQWPLLDGGFDAKQHDLLVSCTEEKFQRMTFNPTPTAHWKQKQQWYDALKSKEPKAKERLRMAMGRSLTDQEIMALLGGGHVSSTADKAEDVDLSDIIGDE